MVAFRRSSTCNYNGIDHFAGLACVPQHMRHDPLAALLLYRLMQFAADARDG